jgi:hypothetical protein
VKFSGILFFFAATGLFTACAVEPLIIDSAGVRFGFPANKSGSKFHQAEALADWALPWNWQYSNGLCLDTELAASLGWLGDTGGDAVIGSVGPRLRLTRGSFPLAVVGGLSPTLLSRWEFGTKNFGCPFQMTSYAGAELDVGLHLRVGYRIQHMSNAGFASHNAGLNLHMLALNFVF